MRLNSFQAPYCSIVAIQLSLSLSSNIWKDFSKLLWKALNDWGLSNMKLNTNLSPEHDDAMKTEIFNCSSNWMEFHSLFSCASCMCFVFKSLYNRHSARKESTWPFPACCHLITDQSMRDCKFELKINSAEKSAALEMFVDVSLKAIVWDVCARFEVISIFDNAWERNYHRR